MAQEVFISYSHIDNQIAHGLCYKLEDQGIKCWIAPRDISVGDVWADAIYKAIPNCKAMLLVLSNNSCTSGQVLREVELAIQNKLVVLPVRIDDIIPTGGMAYYLATTHWINIKGKEIDKKLDLILEKIRKILGAVDSKDKQDEILEDAAEADKVVKKKPPTSKKTDIKPKKNIGISLKKRIIIISSAAIIIVIGLILFLFKDSIFPETDKSLSNTAFRTATPKPENTATKSAAVKQVTPIPTEIPVSIYAPEDFGMDSNIDVEFQDPVLKEIIFISLQKIGVNTEDGVTAGEMAQLRQICAYSSSLNMAPKDAFLEFWNDTGIPMEDAIVLDGQIGDIEPLGAAINLEALMLAGFGVQDIEPLSNLSRIEMFYMPENSISEIDGIENMNNIRFLFLTSNSISDVGVVENLSNLQMVFLADNDISDISPFANLENLNYLDLAENNIEDWRAPRKLCQFES